MIAVSITCVVFVCVHINFSDSRYNWCVYIYCAFCIDNGWTEVVWQSVLIFKLVFVLFLVIPPAPATLGDLTHEKNSMALCLSTQTSNFSISYDEWMNLSVNICRRAQPNQQHLYFVKSSEVKVICPVSYKENGMWPYNCEFAMTTVHSSKLKQLLLWVFIRFLREMQNAYW